ncbi:corA-like Mg2+ transporter family protein [Collimonas fungivorans]|uniref:CorA-like Mg2+ transporter family protein n=1 Tax=Collimonas fungivorans TaxID=158899 RepID=A0A127P7G1_9BURK|nr:magnesium transporter CorA family protein [Collimonas fungivorans]AMO93371.1 corA-like Mg2+ transporter family protein [Collimonas fungivorans]
MDIFLISDNQVSQSKEIPDAVPVKGFLWIDATHEEVGADPEAWRNAITLATGVQIYDPHMTDTLNPNHPSYFDSTQDYGMVVFRKLVLNGNGNPRTTENGVPIAADKIAAPPAAAPESEVSKRRIPAALSKLATQPVTFLIMDHALVTVHERFSRTIDAARARLLDLCNKTEKTPHSTRPPTSPEDLLLRLINAMVDQYLDLRQPLTTQLDRWQRALLDPRRPFKDWMALLDARIELRKLENLCEEQHDAMQELRDYFVDIDDGVEISRAKDLLLVRINDVMEHITRVLNHARRLESSIESAVQIHFSAVAHRTNEIMRTLTVITALFMPLTLITGIFGMNFNEMPLLKNNAGFWITMGSMVVIVVGMLVFFQRRRYLESQALERR